MYFQLEKFLESDYEYYFSTSNLNKIQDSNKIYISNQNFKFGGSEYKNNEE